MKSRRRHNWIWIAFVSLFAIGASAFALATRANAGSAAAASDPLANLSAAQSAPVGVTDAVARVALQRFVADARSGNDGSEQNLSAARRLPTGVENEPTYAIPTTTGDLCFYVENIGEWCTPPLSSTQRAQFGVFQQASGDGVGPLVFGLAGDGISSITFKAGDATETADVHNNVFELTWPSSSASDVAGVLTSGFTSVVATFSDGHTAQVG